MTHSAPTTPQDTTAAGITPELLTSRQAAELCGIGERTLWSWSRSGLAPRPLQIGLGLRPAVRFSRQTLLEWIAGGCKPVKTPGGRAD
jgi:predicted DNA-binding transcriptional regulator AlpA